MFGIIDQANFSVGKPGLEKLNNEATTMAVAEGQYNDRTGERGAVTLLLVSGREGPDTGDQGNAATIAMQVR